VTDTGKFILKTGAEDQIKFCYLSKEYTGFIAVYD
jgi:hypothetical protein